MVSINKLRKLALLKLSAKDIPDPLISEYQNIFSKFGISYSKIKDGIADPGFNSAMSILETKVSAKLKKPIKLWNGKKVLKSYFELDKLLKAPKTTDELKKNESFKDWETFFTQLGIFNGDIATSAKVLENKIAKDLGTNEVIGTIWDGSKFVSSIGEVQTVLNDIKNFKNKKAELNLDERFVRLAKILYNY